MTEQTPIDPESDESTVPGAAAAEAQNTATPENAAADDDTDDLGSGAFDVPHVEEATTDGTTAEEDTSAGEQPSQEHDSKPSKAYLGRPELTPLYAMAGLADLAAAVVRDIANEQIAAYRARRAKAEENASGASATEDLGEKVTEGAQDANAQFNAFLAKAQQRTQEIFEQAVAQYEHLADRGRVAVGDALDNARQQRAKAEEKVGDGAQDGVEDFAAAAQKFADKVTAMAQAAADKVTQATSSSGSSTSPASASTESSDEETEVAVSTATDADTGVTTTPTASSEVPPAAETDAEASSDSTTWDSKGN